MTTSYLKPAIFFSGNCNAAVLRNAVGGIGTITDIADLYYTPNRPYQDWEPDMQQAFGRCAMLFCQVASDSKEFVKWMVSAVPPGCKVLRFAPAILSTLWPFGVNDPRNLTTTGSYVNPEGLYPHCLANAHVMRHLNNGASADDAASRFLNEFRFEDGFLDRFHELSLANQRRMDLDGDLKIGEYVAANFARERLFIAPTHPGGPLFAELLRQIIAELGLSPPSLVEATLARVRAFIGVGAYDAPIHPQIITHFKLQWAGNLIYRHFHEGSFSHDDYVLRYAHLKYTPEYYRAVHLLSLGSVREALPLFNQAVVSNPQSVAFHVQLINAMKGIADPGDIFGVAKRAIEHCPNSGELWTEYSKAAVDVGQFDIAHSAAEAALARGGDPILAWRTKAIASGFLGRLNDAEFATRKCNWYKSLPPPPRPLVAETGAEFGRWYVGYGRDGF